MRLAVLFIVIGIALIAFGILYPNFDRTIYPAGTSFPFSEGPSLNGIIYAGAAITALGVLVAISRLVRR